MTTLAPPLPTGLPKRPWLITFVDLVMLLLAFFVLMFSMSRPDGARFAAVAQSYAAALGGLADVAPSAIRVPQAKRAPGDDLAYLEAVLKSAFARDPDLASLQFRLTAQYLMIELPLPAQAEEGEMPKKATQEQVFKLGGVLSNLPNRIAVVVPSSGEAAAWQQARRQAENVRAALAGSGYQKPLAALVRGVEGGLPDSARVQIFVMPETESVP